MTMEKHIPERIANLAWEDFQARQANRASKRLRECFMVSDFKDAVMATVRAETALPRPPERPAFTGRDLRREFERTGERGGLDAWDYVARYINNCVSDIAASGFAQSGPVDLEKMQKAFEKAWSDCQQQPKNFWHSSLKKMAKYLADAGFRLGDAPTGDAANKVTGNESYQDGYGDAGRALSTRQIIIEQQGDAIYARSYDGRRTLIGFLKEETIA